jgi:hypothetical protein
MLINQKWLADGSVLKKIERFSKQGVERYFCRNDEKIAEVNTDSSRITMLRILFNATGRFESFKRIRSLDSLR